MTRKERIISNIKKIITQVGSLSSGEMNLDCDVCYGSLGGEVVALIEYYNQNDVNVNVYANDISVSEFNVDYENLNEDQLYEILQNLEDYQVEEEKTFKRCND